MYFPRRPGEAAEISFAPRDHIPVANLAPSSQWQRPEQPGRSLLGRANVPFLRLALTDLSVLVMRRVYPTLLPVMLGKKYPCTDRSSS